MSLSTGDKAKFINLLDEQMADDLQPLYSIDILLTKSPVKGAKVGSITVFKANLVDFKMPERYDFAADSNLQKELEAARAQAAQETEVIFEEPILFRETDGRWVVWALNKALEIYDRLGGSCRISVKCPKLRMEQRRSSKFVAYHRADLRSTFTLAWEIDRLLDAQFSFDPWSQQIRRGRISAEMSKR